MRRKNIDQQEEKQKKTGEGKGSFTPEKKEDEISSGSESQENLKNWLVFKRASL